MRISGLTRALLRDLLVPLLCALIALSGIAQARTQGSRTFVSDAAVQFTVCAYGNAAEDDTPSPGHDCSDCCLSRLVAIPAPRTAVPFHVIPVAAVKHETAPRILGGIATYLPWPRGPPEIA